MHIIAIMLQYFAGGQCVVLLEWPADWVK